LSGLTVRTPVQVTLVIRAGAQLLQPDRPTTPQTALALAAVHPKIRVPTASSPISFGPGLFGGSRNTNPEHIVWIWANIDGPSTGWCFSTGRNIHHHQVPGQ